MSQQGFLILTSYLEKVPAIKNGIATGIYEEGFWWVKFQIDIRHNLAWQIVQELGAVINYLSIEDRLPASFYPVSPPPYMNGGPDDFLSWIIESKDKEFKPEQLMEWLEGRLPRPVDDQGQWQTE